MSDKILPIDNAVQQERSAKQPKKRVLRWVLLGVAALLVAFAVCCILLPRVFNFDRVTRFFKYRSAASDSGYGQIRFDSNSTDSYALFDGRFAVGCEDGLYLYDEFGEQVALVQGSLPYPKLCVSKQLAFCYSNESSTLVGMNKKGDAVLQMTAGGTVLDAELSADGCVCYAATDNGCKTLVTVLNRDLQEIYRWKSFSRYLNCCAISTDAARLAIVGLNQVDSVFCSTLSILRTDREDGVVAEVNLGNQIIYELRYLQDNRLCAIGESSTLFFDADGKLLHEYAYEGKTLTDFTSNEGGALFLSFDSNSSGKASLLVSFGADGEVVAQQGSDSEIQSISANGKYLAVLAQKQLTVYSAQLEVYSQTTGDTAANRVLARADGTVLLVSNGQTQLYIP